MWEIVAMMMALKVADLRGDIHRYMYALTFLLAEDVGLWI
jgi:hypothetical protein